MTSSFFEKNEDEVNYNTKKHATRAGRARVEESEMKALLKALSSLSPETHKNAGRFRRIYVYYATHTHTHASDRQKLYTSCNILTNKSLFFCVILKLSLSLLSFTFYLVPQQHK